MTNTAVPSPDPANLLAAHVSRVVKVNGEVSSQEYLRLYKVSAMLLESISHSVHIECIGDPPLAQERMGELEGRIRKLLSE